MYLYLEVSVQFVMKYTLFTVKAILHDFLTILFCLNVPHLNFPFEMHRRHSMKILTSMPRSSLAQSMPVLPVMKAQ